MFFALYTFYHAYKVWPTIFFLFDPVLQKVYHEFHHQLVDVLSDCDTHHSIVRKLHTRAVISQEVMVAQMSGSTAASDWGSSLLTVLGLDDKPHKLKELITVMMEEEKVRSLAEEMTALLGKSEQEVTNHSAISSVLIYYQGLVITIMSLCAPT